MNIRISYQPTAKELARASLLFVDKKPFLAFAVGLINVLVSLVLILIILAFILVKPHHLDVNGWVAIIISCLWLFGRKPFHEWILYQRMKRSIVLSKSIDIDISHNGITWSGKGLRPGNMPWEQVKYILEARNGFVLPNSFTRFLWLPYRGFESPEMVDSFREIIEEKKVVLRVFPRWVC